MPVIKYTQIMHVDNFAGLPTAADQGQIAMDTSTMSIYYFNGTNWSSLVNSKSLIKKELGAINAKNTGQTLIHTLEANPLNFYPFAIVARPSGAGVSGVTLNPTISIGSNASSYNNIASSSLLNNVLVALTAGNSLAASINSPALPGGTSIYANVTVGALATNYNVKYDLLGYYDV